MHDLRPHRRDPHAHFVVAPASPHGRGAICHVARRRSPWLRRATLGLALTAMVDVFVVNVSFGLALFQDSRG